MPTTTPLLRLTSIVRSPLILLACGFLATTTAASVTLYADHGEWIEFSGITQPVASTAGGLLHSLEVGLPPAPDTDLGPHLDFGDCLAATAAWSITALQSEATFVFAETDTLPEVFADALSVGAMGAFTDDDVRFDFPGTTSGGEAIFAFGFTVRDNEFTPGDSIVVGGVGDVVLATLPLPHSPGGSAFVGIVSREPIAWIVVDESSDGDDIAVGDFEIGSQLPPAIHYGLPEEDWYLHVGSHETLHTHDDVIAMAKELGGVPPTPDVPIAPTLTFHKTGGITRAIRLSTLEGSAFWLFEDSDTLADGDEAFMEALSPGDRGVNTHDAWQIEILEGPPVHGLGFMLGDSDDGDGECIEVYNTKDELIAVITPMPAMKGGKAFIGLHAHDEDSIGRVVYHESPDADDISISDIHLAPAGEGCPADFDHDGHVDGSDLGALLAAWGACKEDHCHEDLNKDGVVDAADLGLLLAAWGECGGPGRN